MEGKRPLSPVQNETVRLRLLTKEDLPFTLAWRNQADIRKWFFHSAELTRDQHDAWFEKYRLLDDDFVFIIEDVHTNQAVGQVALYHIDWKTNRAEFGRLMMGESSVRGKGYAKAATRLVCRLGFEALDLVEIYLEVYEHNAPARTVYNACGFRLDRLQDGVAYMSLQRGKLLE